MKYQIRLLTLFFLFGCSIKYQVTSKQHFRPIDNSVFSYRKKNFCLTSSIIDTTKIYCYAYPADKPEYFDCYRFFANGKLLSYRFLDKIDTSAFSDIYAGDVGYYHIKNNTIRTQQFTVFAEHFKDGGGGRLIHYFGTIKGDNIKIDPERKFTKRYYFQPKIGRRFYYMIYKKTNIEAPRLTPDW
ncbi:MAG: hypothetical protein QM534_14785 [Sediminibacterium sp.]|nr:hypothetical protein [Sediminibacterium sp.]